MKNGPDFMPYKLDSIIEEAWNIGFRMSCDAGTGGLLATLAASKPGGRFLELGTGVGAGTAWMLAGMDALSHLTTVEVDEHVQAVAKDHLGSDERVTFEHAHAATWLSSHAAATDVVYDLIFVDCRPGKFLHLEKALELLAPGGLYIVDDLLPQETWPEDHQPRVDEFLARWPVDGLVATPMRWASGILVATRVN
ncbi:O-methyltransferase [Salininema proteolyticum]|uniref:O-methyltransferase n=1 Tax=Salininema proteolyticum TaxID=1607685 RepID=A0ABV8TTY7_9ACTN